MFVKEIRITFKTINYMNNYMTRLAKKKAKEQKQPGPRPYG